MSNQVIMGNVFERELQDLESESSLQQSSGKLQRHLDLCEMRIHEVSQAAPSMSPHPL